MAWGILEVVIETKKIVVKQFCQQFKKILTPKIYWNRYFRLNRVKPYLIVKGNRRFYIF